MGGWGLSGRVGFVGDGAVNYDNHFVCVRTPFGYEPLEFYENKVRR